MTTDTYLTPQEVAELLNIDYQSALGFIKHSGVSFLKIGRRYRVSKQVLEKFLLENQRKRIEIEPPDLEW